MESTQALKVGAPLQNGKYKIVRFISCGGFGCTYEAIHTGFGTRVAIKEFFVKDFCNREDSSSVSVGTQSKISQFTKLKKKFIEEAKVLHSMHHPGLIHVSDIFEENGTAYYVMDYIDGYSLQEIIQQKGPLSEAEALDYILQVAQVLEYVHSKNRLHLDIKPGNIMIDHNGKAILIDFGASKHYDEETGENTSTLLGINTKGYAPIEQMNQSFKTFNAATDIYSLGATLYKILTGITPPDAILIAGGEIDKPSLPSDFSSNIRTAVSQAMMLKRTDRPQSMSEFVKIINGEQSINVRKTDESTENNDSTTLTYQNHENDNVTFRGTNGAIRLSMKKQKRYLISLIGLLLLITGVGVFFINGENSSSSTTSDLVAYHMGFEGISIGDYVYADGSYSNVLDSANIENCSGCVYNLSTSDYEQANGWTHGHIVALKDATNRTGEELLQWGAINKSIPNTGTYKDAVTYKDGYWYCLLDSAHQSPAISSLEDFDGKNFDVPLPKGAKWYVPTVADWRDIILNLGSTTLSEESSSLTVFDNSIVSPILQKKIGAFPKMTGKELGDEDYSYWTCIQQGEEWTPDGVLPRAWAIYGENEFGYIGNSPTRNKMRVRPVSAF